jgi:hypothetical protein
MITELRTGKYVEEISLLPLRYDIDTSLMELKEDHGNQHGRFLSP